MPQNEGDRRRGAGASGLPGAWRVIWLAKGERAREEAAARGALRLELSAVAEHGDSVSTVFWRHSTRPWGREGFPLGEAIIALPELPALDEVWTLAMWIRRERGEDLPPAWEAMARYASDVRQGLFPDRVPPEHAVQSVYLALAQETLLGVKPDRDRFLEEALALCDHIGRRLEEGARLLDDDLLGSVPALQRYISLLAADRDLYREDRSRGRRFWAEIPAAHSPTRTARRLPLLVLEQPVARQFKLWARRDPEAPGGAGYPLLLTKLSNDAVVLSADPGQRVTVGWLASGLTELEEAARGGGDEKKAAWYDGRNHNGTLCAAPLDGTKLTMDAVLRHFKGELRLRPIANEARRRTALMAGAALAVALLGGGSIALALRGGGDNRTAQVGATREADRADEESRGTDLPRGAKGEPLAKDEVINLIGSDSGPRAMRHFAVVAGVCSYEGDQKLYSPCRDARAMRDLLINEYGYKRDDIVFLVDKGEGGERVDGPPTAEVMKTKVERFRSKYGDEENSTFLFYYSGHGGYVKGAQADFGVLQPSGFFTSLKDQPYQHRGWDMQRLIDDIKKGVPSRHIMLILDACYSGWAGAKGDDDLDERVRSLWKERAEVVLSAGSKGQRAWEDEVEEKAWVWGGHSVMTAFVLEGLKRTSEGFAGADKNKDGIVTDEELAAFVKERVPASVKQFKKATQAPAMFRLDQGYVKSGQFLFVPHDGAPPK
jgi:hypothetical protein